MSGKNQEDIPESGHQRPSVASLMLVIATLAIALLWFVASPGYEPLLALIGGIGAAAAIDRAPKSWQLDLIVAVLVLVVLLAGTAVVVFELVTGNVQLLLWLHIPSFLALMFEALVVSFAIISLYILAAREPSDRYKLVRRKKGRNVVWRYPNKALRMTAAVTISVSIVVFLIGIVGYRVWHDAPAKRSVVLVANFVGPDGSDSNKVTRVLVQRIRDALRQHPDIEVRTLGWAITDDEGEGKAYAHEVGRLAKAGMVIWGDYLFEPDFEMYVHYEVLPEILEIAEVRDVQVFGGEDVKQVAKAQFPQLPDMVAFKYALGDDLGYLVAFANGLIFSTNHQFSEALPYFDTASGIYGNPLARDMEPIVHFHRGLAYQGVQDYSVAMAEFTKAISTAANGTNPVNEGLIADVYSQRGFVQLATKQYDQALEDLNNAIAFDAKSANTYLNRGATFFAKHRYDEALADFSRALEIDPMNFTALRNRVGIYLMKQMPTEALDDARRTVDIEPDNADAYLSLGLAQMAVGDCPSARATFTKAIALDSDNSTAYTYRGLVSKECGDYQGALADYSTAIDLDVNDPSAYVNRAGTYFHLKNYSAAIRDYTSAIELFDENVDASDQVDIFRYRGLAYANVKNSEAAIADYLKVIELEPDDYWVWLNLGLAHSSQGDKQLAMADFSKAIELDSSFGPAYYNRGRTYYDDGDLESAIREYSIAIELDPTDVSALVMRGIAYQDMENHDAAIADYTDALEIAPTHPIARLNRANAYSDNGELEMAIDDYTKVIEAVPEPAVVYNFRALVFVKLGKVDAAIADYSKAIELEPRFPAVYGNRGMAYLEIGKDVEALRDLEKFLELMPNASNRDEIVETIDRLKSKLDQ